MTKRAVGRTAGPQPTVIMERGRVDERDGQKLQVFFVAAPDGLCYYFHQPIVVLPELQPG